MCNCNDNEFKPCENEVCGCLSEYSGECITYDGEELPNTSIAIGLNFNVLIKKIDEYFGIFKNEINNFLSIVNLGNGAKIYKNDSLLGEKQLRTLISSNSSLTILENTDEIEFRAEPASEVLAGNIEIATQAEVNAGLDSVRAVTPSTLNSLISNPSNLPNATETQRGIAEIATQAEVNAGLDSEKIISPSKLKQGVETVVQDSTIIEQFLETEIIDTVQNSTDLQNFITNISENVSNEPSNLPNATETQRGIAEIATQAEVNAGLDSEKFVTPATLAAKPTDTLNNIPVGLISMWSGSPSNLPTGWSLCDGTNSTPNLRGKFVVGYDVSDVDYNSIGNTGGVKEVTLTEAQLPDITITTNAWGRETQQVNDGNGAITADNEGTATLDTPNTQNQPHENRPPYYTIAYIMYTG